MICFLAVSAPETLMFAWLLGGFQHSGSSIVFCLSLLAILGLAIKLVRSSSALDKSSGDLENIPVLYCPQCGHKDPGGQCQSCGFQIITS